MSKITNWFIGLKSLFVSSMKLVFRGFSDTTSFIFLLSVYLTTSFLTGLLMSRFLPIPWSAKNFTVQIINSFYQRIVKLNHLNEDSINRTNLIQLALYNMKFKKSRTFITVGGMAIGVAAIVYLVSIGYGLQELVISRVARLEEMRQANISAPVGGQAKINDKTIDQIKDVNKVDKVMPQIAAVGRVSLNSSVSDVVVYGVTADYLIHSAIRPSSGKLFENNQVSTEINELKPEIAGVYVEEISDASFGARIGQVDYSIDEGEWLRVRESPDSKAKLLGFTRRSEAVQSGYEVWGAAYSGNNRPESDDEDGITLNRWIESSVRIWEKKPCEKDNFDCEDGQYVALRDDNGLLETKIGYFAQLSMIVQPFNTSLEPEVLGDSTESGEVLQAESSIEDSGDFVELEGESIESSLQENKKIELGDAAVKEVVVNTSALSLLGLQESDAINSKINLSFVLVGELLESNEQKVESIEEEYTIIGVIQDDRTPVMYVPFIDIRSLGVVNYSQAKVLTNNQNDLPNIRAQIESLGFNTQSVYDTVSQINSLFSTARTVLFAVGMAALAVASLGMFNTLTVSLLERTREVGLMKAMGMRSAEVHELFLTESMIMGLFGGIAGLVLGVMAGQVTSIILSVIAWGSGNGYLNVSYTPPVFILVILGLAIIVGLLTGLYPARHATRISALNALRYE